MTTTTRSIPFMVRLTPEERYALKVFAKKRGVSASAYVVGLIRDATGMNPAGPSWKDVQDALDLAQETRRPPATLRMRPKGK